MTVVINHKAILWLIAVLGAFTLLNLKLALYWSNKLCQENVNSIIINNTFTADNLTHDRYSPIIFIGGMPRSGTTLMRAMLESHPEIRCGQETRFIPRILDYRLHMLDSKKEIARLDAAGVSADVLESAFAKLILEIIEKHDYAAPRLCNKDPLALQYGPDVIKLFPNAKFLFMIRDGRAVVHSIIMRNITISDMDLKSYRNSFHKWNDVAKDLDEQCRNIGKNHCMRVYYEQLVMQPKKWMKKILDYLDVSWNDAVLHHENFINKTKGVHLSDKERSTDQVVHPIYLDSLSNWFGYIPEDVMRDLAEIAPMQSVFGYDKLSYPPDYSKMKIIDE